MNRFVNRRAPRPDRRHRPFLGAALALSLLGTGCAAISSGTAPTDDSPAADFARSRLVALDFVDAMVRLPELEPARTTLYTERPASRFGELLVGALQGSGYDLRLGTGEAPATLDYRVVRDAAGTDEDPDGSLYTFLVEAGPVRLRRSYRVDLAGVQPASAMQLHGADERALAAADSRFDAPARPAAVTTRAVPRRVEPILQPVAPSDVTPVARPVSRPVSVEAVASDRSGNRNLFETGRSNYADILARYETLSREVMVFPNDSLRMGAANKRRAVELAADFDPERDVISVLGCSHGPTALDNGNETLANGRAVRVKEELMLAGIGDEHVLEEGCWAGSAHRKLPGRGVVVTHKRLAAG